MLALISAPVGSEELWRNSTLISHNLDFSGLLVRPNLRFLVSHAKHRSFRLPRTASLGLRLIASSVMLVLLLTRFPAGALQQRWPECPRTSWLWLLAALIATFAAFGLAALRWFEVCRTLGHDLKYSAVFSYFLAGQFVGNFLPTTVGGDILRVSRMGTQIRDHSSAFASVVIERLTGWLVLPVITLLALALQPGLVTSRAGAVALLGALGTLGLLLVLILMAQHQQLGGRIRGNNRISTSLSAVHDGLNSYRKVPASMLRLLFVAVAFQACLIAAVICIASSIGIETGFVNWIAFIPMVFIAQVLPVAIGGIGIREAALVLFLGGSNISSGQSVVLGLAIYAVTLVASLAGAVPFVIGGRRSITGETT